MPNTNAGRPKKIMNSQQLRFTVPNADTEVIAWTKCQHNLSNSIRALIKGFIATYGYIDNTCMPIAAQQFPIPRAVTIAEFPVQIPIAQTHPVLENAPAVSVASVPSASVQTFTQESEPIKQQNVPLPVTPECVNNIPVTPPTLTVQASQAYANNTQDEAALLADMMNQ